jgi:hypothetical protein
MIDLVLVAIIKRIYRIDLKVASLIVIYNSLLSENLTGKMFSCSKTSRGEDIATNHM